MLVLVQFKGREDIMNLEAIDVIIILIYLALMIGIGIAFRKTASENIKSFFLGGKNMTWWVAGVSLVATTFGADTPLAVSELVDRNGVAGNWIWWNLLAGGMLTTFFFSKLWYKANLITDLELVEVRYSGKPAFFLRGFKAIYMGVIMNTMIIAWGNLALIAILKVFFGIDTQVAILLVLAAMVIVVIYSSMAGLLGVAITDFIQFFMAMGACIVFAYILINKPEIGGIDGLKEKLPNGTLSFLPQISTIDNMVAAGNTYTLSISTFIAFICMYWWASWYPGADPGGGGYVVQRLLSTKNEQHAIASTLFFQIAHYCLRPWPWILVGLCVILLYPNMTQEESWYGFVYAMRDHLPMGLKGLMVTAFFAAYMSTISGQFNWGASIMINDLYQRFIDPSASDKKLVRASRVATLIMMIVSLGVTFLYLTNGVTLKDGWQMVIDISAGMGFVLIMRWYWWRINVWAELTATLLPILLYPITILWLEVPFPYYYFVNVGITVVASVAVAYLAPATDMNTLKAFYERVRPQGAWKPVKLAMGIKDTRVNLFSLFLCWASAITMTYALLFFIGNLIFKEWNNAFMMLSLISGSFVILAYHSKKIKLFE